ncbi:hypothetical protein Rleg9DRAFT_1747 [Rhizobium leguminosarum bv. trifolii WSM597]|uniref:Uncharacterized protein n=1 Tax=Rhizobium leguminosarum bv. trifolii WSM597 TaxID=754764 RepID=I9N8A6_RHILT|nr:hypothetical protein [Rhizobium leguminosarum]EJB02932.1 hypothetical protein Rleg9DRAFT_1747 [Rhizobium leguminosarum bv. trifolii WSM597]
MDDFKPGDKMPDSVPVSIGARSRLTVAACIRKWSAGAALTERERDLVDEAIFRNRLQMIEAVFEDRETADVG